MTMLRRLGPALLAVVLLATSVLAQGSAERLVPLTPAVTQIVLGLGAGDLVVAVPGGTERMPETAGLPRISHGRTPSAEAILAVRPTLVIGDSSLDRAVRTQLERAGVRLRLVTAVETPSAASERIAAVGELLGRADAARALQQRMRQQFGRAAAMHRHAQPAVLFVYARGPGTVYAAGTNTGIATLITLSGGRNAVQAFEGFKPLTAEAVLAAQPEVLVLTSDGLASLGGIDGLLRLPGMAATSAGRTRRVVRIDDELVLGFGPRVGEAAVALATAFLGIDENQLTSARKR